MLTDAPERAEVRRLSDGRVAQWWSPGPVKERTDLRAPGDWWALSDGTWVRWRDIRGLLVEETEQPSLL